MGTQTTNYSFHKPTTGGDLDTWGDDFTGGDTPLTDPSPGINGNWEKLDQKLYELETEIDNNKYQVGDVYITTAVTTAAAVATRMGYGTWAAYAEGRAMVGVGSADYYSWSNGTLRGTDRFQISSSQMPSHNHSVDPPNTTSSSSTITFAFNIRRGEGGADIITNQNNLTKSTTSGSASRVEVNSPTDDYDRFTFSESHAHSVNISSFTSGSAGGTSYTYVVQPSIGVYMWERTA